MNQQIKHSHKQKKTTTQIPDKKKIRVKYNLFFREHLHSISVKQCARQLRKTKKTTSSSVNTHTSLVPLTLLWTHVCPQGCSTQTAWHSTGGGTPYTRQHASHRWWAEAHATPRPAGNCGCASGWPRTWKDRSTDALWSAGPPHGQWRFAGQKNSHNTLLLAVKVFNQVLYIEKIQNTVRETKDQICPCLCA